MASRILAPGIYILVYATLIAITCVSVFVSFVNLPHVWHVVIALIIASTKSTLVVLIFMHVLYSPRLTWIVILTAVFWLGILIINTLADYFSRGLIPYMPGH